LKRKLLVILLVLSVATNLFVFGRWILVDQWATPSSEEKIILSELIQRTVESEDYKTIEEPIVAIEATMDRNKGGVFPYYFAINVHTDEQKYVFSCSNEACDTMQIDSLAESRYQDESPRIPLTE